MATTLWALVLPVLAGFHLAAAQQSCLAISNLAQANWQYELNACPPGVHAITLCQYNGFLYCVYDQQQPPLPPVAADTTTTTVAATMSQSTLPSPACGLQVQSKIVGGKNDGTCIPWLASVQAKVNENGGNLFTTCSAVLISTSALLTAASCFDWQITNTQIQVVIGDNSTFVTEDHEVLKPVNKLIIHPNYNKITKDNNIAILKLKTPVIQSPCVTPICLPSPGVKTDHTTTCKIGGYGKKNATAIDISETVLLADTLVLPRTICSLRDIPPPKTICTVTYTDACSGDDGGMVSCIDATKSWYLAGLIRDPSAYSCGNSGRPSYHTDVQAYLDWIKLNY